MTWQGAQRVLAQGISPRGGVPVDPGVAIFFVRRAQADRRRVVVQDDRTAKGYVRDDLATGSAPADRAAVDLDGPKTETAQDAQVAIARGVRMTTIVPVGPAMEIDPEREIGRGVRAIVQVDLEVAPTGIGLTIGPVIGRTGTSGADGVGTIGRMSIVTGITTGIRITSIGSTTTGGVIIPTFVAPTT